MNVGSHNMQLDFEKIVISLINFQVELAMKFVETLEID